MTDHNFRAWVERLERERDEHMRTLAEYRVAQAMELVAPPTTPEVERFVASLTPHRRNDAR